MTVPNASDATGAAPAADATRHAQLELENFLPYRLSVLSNRVSQTIADLLRDRVSHVRLKIPFGEGRLIAALHANGKVLAQQVRGKHLIIEAVLSAAYAATLDPKWIQD